MKKTNIIALSAVLATATVASFIGFGIGHSIKADAAPVAEKPVVIETTVPVVIPETESLPEVIHYSDISHLSLADILGKQAETKKENKQPEQQPQRREEKKDVWSVQDCQNTKYVAVDSLTVRSQATTNSEAIGTYGYNAPVAITGNVYHNNQLTNWVRVNYNGMKGYVAGEYLANQPQLDKNPDSFQGESWYANVQKGYLALRCQPSKDDSVEIAKIQNGMHMTVINKANHDFWYVHVDDLNMDGFVNSNFLSKDNNNVDHSKDADSFEGENWTVNVEKGFLGLRTAPVNDEANIIGELQNGMSISVINKINPTYWYVHSNDLGINGFVNSNFLTK